MGGYDEKYIANGDLIIEEGLKNTKLLPVISLYLVFHHRFLMMI